MFPHPAIGIVVLQVTAAAPIRWTRVDGEGPPARIISALAPDPSSGHLLLFGGDRFRSAPIGDTWEFDGVHWRQVDSTGPVPRYGHGAVGAAAWGGVVIFGGYNKRDTLHADLWVRRPGGWDRLTPEPGGSAPAPRRSPGAAFDIDRERLVINNGFGGLGRDQAHVFHADTWEFDGRRWSLAARDGPEPRYGNAMIYDPVRKVVLLFGGNDHADHIYGDTWTWDGKRWSRLDVTGPSRRGGAQLVWDPDGLRVILFGGFARDSVYTDVWGWNGREWSRLPSEGGPELIFPVMSYHAASRRLVLVGQRQGGAEVETWVAPLR